MLGSLAPALDWDVGQTSSSRPADGPDSTVVHFISTSSKIHAGEHSLLQNEGP
jgi:hypothetical protein